MIVRGKALTPKVKELIVSVKHYFDRYKFKKKFPYHDVVE